MTDVHPPVKVITIDDLTKLPERCYMYSGWELEHALKMHRKMGYTVTEVYLWKHESAGYVSFFIEFEEEEDETN